MIPTDVDAAPRRALNPSPANPTTSACDEYENKAVARTALAAQKNATKNRGLRGRVFLSVPRSLLLTLLSFLDDFPRLVQARKMVEVQAKKAASSPHSGVV
mmetsp:Transcript_12527/g.26999  ORF Transcript_12527/g.26999 Transcript_12527/m.26999 type:complete len:101 (+) Transcript_12527:1656-1958(+)